MGRRIVVIEDDETIGTAVAERLRSEGFMVDVAADGLAGVELVTSTSPDLVVLDMMLPESTAWKCAGASGASCTRP